MNAVYQKDAGLTRMRHELDEKLELRDARRKPLHAGRRSAVLIAWRDLCTLGFERRVIC